MIRRPVTSKNLASVGWEEDDSGHGVMEVEFRSGHIYRYANVPESEYLALLGASSPGQFLAERIDGVYEHRRL
jgi:hypothetical protein